VGETLHALRAAALRQERHEREDRGLAAVLFVLGLILGGLASAEGSSDLGDQAASYAESILGVPYLWGGKGWDWNPDGGWNWPNGKFVDSSDIRSGYNYFKPSAGKVALGKGIDCSGLCLWAFNKAAGATKYRDPQNPIYAEGADGQWADTARFQQISKSVPTVNVLEPGYLLFLDTPSMGSGFPDHMAMYVGNGYVIHSKGGVGVEKRTLDDWLNLPVKDKKYRDYFFGYGWVKADKKQVTDNPHLEWDSPAGHNTLDLSLSANEWKEGETVTARVSSFSTMGDVTHLRCPVIKILEGRVEIVSVEPPTQGIFVSAVECEIRCSSPLDGSPIDPSQATFTVTFRLGKPAPNRVREPWIAAYLQADPYFGGSSGWPSTCARLGLPVKGTRNFHAGTFGGESYSVEISSNSAVSDFSVSPTDESVSFDVSGEEGTEGFCRVSIPTDLMWCDSPEEWTVKMDDQPIDHTVAQESGLTDISLQYVHSIHKVEITGTHSLMPSFEYASDDPLGDLFDSKGTSTTGEGSLDIGRVELACEESGYVARINLLGAPPASVPDPSVFIEWDLLIDSDRNANTRSWGPFALIDNGLGVDVLIRVCLDSEGYSGHALAWPGGNETYSAIDYSVDEGVVELHFDTFLIGNPAPFDYVVAVRKYVGNQMTADKSPDKGHATFPLGEGTRMLLIAALSLLAVRFTRCIDPEARRCGMT